LKLSIEEAERLMNNGNNAKAFATLYRTWERDDFKDNKELLMVYQKLYELSRIKYISFSYKANSFEGHRYGVASVSLSADGSYAISGSYDSTLKLWDVNTGQCLRTFKGHSGYVKSVSLSADGEHAISGGFDKTVKLWSLSTGHCQYTFGGHSGWVHSVCLSADGKYALSGGHNGTINLWRLIWKLKFDEWDYEEYDEWDL